MPTQRPTPAEAVHLATDLVAPGETGGALVLRCQLLRGGASLPCYQTAGAAGLDLCFCPAEGEDARRTLQPGARLLLGTGVALAIPAGYEGQVRPRSGWALKHGVTVLNSPGTVDSDYRGEVKVLLINLGDAAVEVRAGDRIAQLVLAPVARGQLQAVPVLDETARGAGGYGHTGVGAARP